MHLGLNEYQDIMTRIEDCERKLDDLNNLVTSTVEEMKENNQLLLSKL